MLACANARQKKRARVDADRLREFPNLNTPESVSPVICQLKQAAEAPCCLVEGTRGARCPATCPEVTSHPIPPDIAVERHQPPSVPVNEPSKWAPCKVDCKAPPSSQQYIAQRGCGDLRTPRWAQGQRGQGQKVPCGLLLSSSYWPRQQSAGAEDSRLHLRRARQ